MSLAAPLPPLRAGRRWWVPLAAALLALVAWWSPLRRPAELALGDAQAVLAQRAPALDDVLVLDIDEASLRALHGTLGPWPLPREAHALVTRYLQEAGASAVVYDVLFADAREGDAAFAQALAGAMPVVLAATGQRIAAGAAAEGGGAPPAFLTVPAAAPAFAWPAILLPERRLWAAHAPHLGIGVVSTPLDDDGRLRRLPVLHRQHDLLLPTLPVAALAALTPRAPLVYDAARAVFRLGACEWPVNAAGEFALPATPAAVPTLPFSTVALAALGAPGADDAALKAKLRGRVVFVGSSALDPAGVTLARASVPGTSALALAFGALRAGAVPRPPAAPMTLVLLLIAAAPSLLALRGGAPSLAREAAAAGTALAAIALAAAGSLGLAATPVELFAPLVLLFAGLACCALAQYRWTLLQQRRLDDERALALAASHAKSEFLARVSHEIRTPMNAVLGIAELMAETPLSAEQRRHVEVFRRAGETLAALIDDLLDLSKIEAGRLELHPAPFALRAMLAERVALLRPQAEQKGLRLDLSVAEGVPEAAVGDGLRLGQVLVNLLGNAVKFTRYGHVALAVAPAAGRPGEIEFVVSDTGTGIDRDRLQDIFLPFTQGGAGIARDYGGTGLGLAIARHLVAMMGGQILVESVPGQGSSFRFALPLQAADTAALPAAQPARAIGPARGLRILVAEDNTTNVYLLQGMLKGGGHRIEVVTNGEQALASLRRQRYDLVLMDVQMPVLDGLAATREWRRVEAAERRQRTPVVALTANAFGSDISASIAAGCDAHLSKPVSKATLLQALTRFVPESATPPPAAPVAASPAVSPAPTLEGIARETGLDVRAALERLGDAGLYVAALQRCVETLGRWPADFEAAPDAVAARRLAHDLKGLCATIGETRIAADAAALEKALRDDGAASPLAGDVSRQVRAFVQRLERALGPAAG